MRILIPTDFTELSDFATIMADKLKSTGETEVHFLHIVEWGYTEEDASGSIQVAEGDDTQFLVKKLVEAKTKMDALKSRRPGDTFHILFGPRTQTLVEYAESNHFDLIVMGTRGASGLSRWLSGSETQHIARISKVPVMSLMCNRSDLVIKNILIVHDFLDKPPVNMPLLKILENGLGATSHLLYVNTEEGVYREDVEKKMNTFAELNEISNTEFHIHADRNIASGVTHYNQMNNMDLLFIGTEGRRGLGRLLKSSVAEKLINNLYKPIITFHI